jgi:CHAT domain
MSPQTQEFHITVIPLATVDEYLIRTERVATGVPLAEEQVKWSVDNWLSQTRLLMSDPLLNLLQDEHSDVNFSSFGQDLYNNLFCGSIRDSWMIAQAIAQNHGAVLRLRLGLKGDILPSLPWEILHTGDHPIATGTEISFSRYLHLNRRLQPILPVNQGHFLKVLMVISAPNDQENLALQLEAQQLEIELNHSSINGVNPIQVEILAQPGRKQLTQALEMGNYQIFHYAGHSNFSSEGGELYLVNTETGLTESLSGDDLAGLLVNNGVELAVFNSCHSANYILERSANSNLAHALVKRGINGVLAMAEKIPDEVALTLTKLFYRNLYQGFPIDLSLNRARQGLISAYGSKHLYWALPVLYLHPDYHGFLTTNIHNQDQIKKLSLTANDEYSLMGIGGESQFNEADLQDDFDIDTNTYDDGYEEDSAVIADLFQQINKPENQEIIPSNSTETEVKYVEIPPEKPIINKQYHHINNNFNNFNLKKLLLIITGVIALGTGGFWLLQKREYVGKNSILNDGYSVSINITKNQKLDKLNTANLTAYAIDRFNQKDLNNAEKAIEELIKPERGALEAAETALAAVPHAQRDDTQIMFLKGRIAWQSAQTGNNKYSIDDARRYWEFCVKREPKNLNYLNALGFAYYQQKLLTQATKIWFEAIYLNTSEHPPQELLTSYAGLALSLKQLAKTKPPEQQEKLLKQSRKLYNKVILANSKDFQTASLTKNWLWTEKALQDWLSFGN